jgi:hypothetical protein
MKRPSAGASRLSDASSAAFQFMAYKSDTCTVWPASSSFRTIKFFNEPFNDNGSG